MAQYRAEPTSLQATAVDRVPSSPGLPVPAVINCAGTAPARTGRGPHGAASSQPPGRLPGGDPSRPGAAVQPTVPRHRRVPGGETIDTAACTAPPALSRGTCVSRQDQQLELAPEPGPPGSAAASPPAASSRAELSAPRPRGLGLQLPSGPAVGPMAGAGACGARRLRGGLSKQPRDWLRGRTAARGLWEAE